MKTISQAARNSFDRLSIEGADLDWNDFYHQFRIGAEFVQRWIPVEEELPEIGKEVLTKTHDNWYRIITFGIVAQNFPSQVTHWRPIEHEL